MSAPATRASRDPRAHTTLTHHTDPDGTYTAAGDADLDALLIRRGWVSITAGAAAGEDDSWDYPPSFTGPAAEAALEIDSDVGPTNISVDDDGTGYLVADPHGNEQAYTDRNALLDALAVIESWRYA